MSLLDQFRSVAASVPGGQAPRPIAPVAAPLPQQPVAAVPLPQQPVAAQPGTGKSWIGKNYPWIIAAVVALLLGAGAVFFVIQKKRKKKEEGDALEEPLENPGRLSALSGWGKPVPRAHPNQSSPGGRRSWKGQQNSPYPPSGEKPPSLRGQPTNVPVHGGGGFPSQGGSALHLRDRPQPRAPPSQVAPLPPPDPQKPVVPKPPSQVPSVPAAAGQDPHFTPL